MELTRNIMMASIIAFFMVVFFFVFVHRYSKWYWYRHRQPSNMNSLSEQRGLDTSILKTIQFHHEAFKEGLECAVCLSELDEGDKARILPKCDHGFHVECIDMWFHSHSTCPICRNPVTDDQTEMEQQESETHVLIGGDEAHIHDEEQASSSSLQTYKDRGRPDLVIDIIQEQIIKENL